MNNFETQAQEVWRANSIGEKKTILIEMVMNFDHKDKTTKFLQVISKLDGTAFCLAQADKLASDLMLRDTDKVI